MESGGCSLLIDIQSIYSFCKCVEVNLKKLVFNTNKISFNRNIVNINFVKTMLITYRCISAPTGTNNNN